MLSGVLMFFCLVFFTLFKVGLQCSVVVCMSLPNLMYASQLTTYTFCKKVSLAQYEKVNDLMLLTFS